METSVTRICKKCGQEKAIEKFDKNIVKEKLYYRYTCITCRGRVRYESDKNKEWYKKMKKVDLEKHKVRNQKIAKNWRDNNPEKIIAIKKSYKEKHGQIFIKSYHKNYYQQNIDGYKKRSIIHKKAYIENLADCFVRECLVNNNSFLSAKDIPQELVELKRKQLKLKRDAKQEKENHSNGCD